MTKQMLPPSSVPMSELNEAVYGDKGKQEVDLPADLTKATDTQLWTARKQYMDFLACPLDFGQAPMRVAKLKNAVDNELRKRGHEVAPF